MFDRLRQWFSETHPDGSCKHRPYRQHTETITGFDAFRHPEYATERRWKRCDRCGADFDLHEREFDFDDDGMRRPRESHPEVQ